MSLQLPQLGFDAKYSLKLQGLVKVTIIVHVQPHMVQTISPMFQRNQPDSFREVVLAWCGCMEWFTVMDPRTTWFSHTLHAFFPAPQNKVLQL